MHKVIMLRSEKDLIEAVKATDFEKNLYLLKPASYPCLFVYVKVSKSFHATHIFIYPEAFAGEPKPAIRECVTCAHEKISAKIREYHCTYKLRQTWTRERAVACGAWKPNRPTVSEANAAGYNGLVGVG